MRAGIEPAAGPGPVLVFSSRRDVVNYEPVVSRLARAGLDPLVLRFDDVVAGTQQLSVAMRGGRAEMTVDGRRFSADVVAAAWWRKPHWTGIDRADGLVAASLGLELDRATRAVAGLIDAAAWLNAPDAMSAAEGKLRQLAVAAGCGFLVPDTIVGNDWAAVDRAADERALVFKSFRGTVQTREENRIVFTTQLTPDRLDALRGASPWPGIFQTRVAGAREWRITVVGESVLPAAVLLRGDLVDWRRHQFDGGVRFAARELDATVAAACRSLTRRLDLRYAAIDLIEDADGRFWFLEANPNGQYGWLERELGLPVSELIASELAAIARRQTVPPVDVNRP
jgi:glutathione synthase/RimK-type ligase-like ATP-grasp enzyme